MPVEVHLTAPPRVQVARDLLRDVFFTERSTCGQSVPWGTRNAFGGGKQIFFRPDGEIPTDPAISKANFERHVSAVQRQVTHGTHGDKPPHTIPPKLRKSAVIKNLLTTLGHLKPAIEKEKQIGCLGHIHPVVTRDMIDAGSMVIALEAANRAANPKTRRDPNELVNGRMLWTSQDDETGRASEIVTIEHLGGLALMPPYEGIGPHQPKNILHS